MKNFKVKLSVDKNVKPVAQPHRRVPYHLRKAVEEELKELEENDIIEKVQGPTPWVSPMVVVPKPKDPGKVRLCVDMRVANKAIERQRHVMPTIEDVLEKANGAKFFSKLDLNKGFHQLELDEASRDVTVFSTHKGLYRYKRLYFGINAAPEIFQDVMRQVVADIKGADALQDDTLVFGKTRKEHDEALREVLRRFKSLGLTLNLKKCEFYVKQIRFYGYILTEHGVSPDDSKVSAIQDAKTPEGVKELRSFLGTTGFLMRFVPDYSTLVEPLQRLTKNNTPWTWGPEQINAMEELKRRLTNAPTLVFFYQTKKSALWVDASPVGLGAVLLQMTDDQKLEAVAYASRTLNPTEQRYSQIEREALGIVWACKRFRLYLFGKEFLIYTDHKPLVTLFGNPNAQLPARIERWQLQMGGYKFEVQYKPGPQNIADFLSRNPVEQPTVEDNHFTESVEGYSKFCIATVLPKAITLNEVRESTMQDPTLCNAMKILQRGKYFKDQMPEVLKKIWSELHTSEGIFLRNKRIVIPSSLVERVIRLAHVGHQGIVKTLKLLRTKVWFPGMNEQVQKCIETCLACQTTVPQQTKEPLCMTELPKRPWQEVACDFYGPIDNSCYLMVLVDEHSRYPVVEKIKSLSSTSVTSSLLRIFGLLGIPEVIKTDNGPPFFGHDFAIFCETYGMKHRKITPYWPQANGTAERFMRNIKKTIHAAQTEQTDWNRSMEEFLRNYRSTPHSSTGETPFKLMFGRDMQTTIPQMLDQDISISEQEKLRNKDRCAKEKMKRYAEKSKVWKCHDFKRGDTVLFRKMNPRKLDPHYEKEPYLIVDIKGSMITAKKEGGRCVTRNCSFFKKIAPEFSSSHSQVLDQQCNDQLILENLNILDEVPAEDNQLPREQPIIRYNLRLNRRPPRRLVTEL